LANEITNLSDAATLYPLFGLGANLAQAIAGLVLKATTRGGATEFATALQASMAAVVVIACIAIMLQQHITNKAAEAAAALRHRHAHRHNSATSSSTASGADLTRAATPVAPANPTITTTPPPPPAAAAAAAAGQSSSSQQDASSSSAAAQPDASAQETQSQKRKRQASLAESFRILAASVELRCLATMSLAQGLCNSLMEFAWKCHMRILYPSPADFTAFLGECC
jgi:AAA family ATP:ADP antiporter